MMDPILSLEETVIGGLLLDSSQLPQVDLAPEDFVSSTHRQIFEVIRRIASGGGVPDVVTVADALQRQTGRDQWLPITAKLAQDTMSPRSASKHAELVKQRSRSRQAREIANRLLELADAEPAESIDHAIRSLMALNSTAREWNCGMPEAMGLAIDALDRAHREGGKLSGISTGIRDLDADLGGMHPGDLIVVAARPAMGKTAWMLNNAIGAEVPLGIISGEQGRVQIAQRMIAIRGSISAHNMRLGKIDDEEWSRINTAIARLRNSPIWLFDKPGPTIAEIERQARSWRYEKRIKLLMVDYLQKIAGQGKDKRLEVGDVAQRLKNLGRELDIPIQALAQVKREVETRPIGEDGMGRLPYMGDIAESAIVEQEADQVMTLYRPHVYLPEERFKGKAVVNVCKNRHGPTGCIDVSWRGEYLQFGDLSHSEQGGWQ